MTNTTMIYRRKGSLPTCNDNDDTNTNSNCSSSSRRNNTSINSKSCRRKSNCKSDQSLQNTRTLLPMHMAMLLSVALIAIISPLLVIGVHGDYPTASALTQNLCTNKASCRECLQASGCAWCLEPNMPAPLRCHHNVTEHHRCEEKYRYYPINNEEITINRELTTKSSGAAWSGGYGAGGYAIDSSYSEGHYASGHSSSSVGSAYGYGAAGSANAAGHIVQLQPQRVKLQLRINEEYSLRMNYSQAEDYPIDLYYLMDLSKSMEDDKDKLSKLGDQLSNTMRNITTNFRLGFGSFVDKVLMPYVSTIPKNIQEPCPKCAPPYGYSHIMSLNTDTKEFSNQVSLAAVSGNLDAPEGGFDAIMQAIACRSQIGWREQARRLLVFSTDAGFHYAGDGKLGGVIAPNDGECHLDSNGYYSHSTIQDYPSISQINQKVKQNSINIIFAVTANQKSVYEKLSQHIEGSSSAVLSNDSSNVVELVKEEYGKISSTIEMKDNATSNVKITYYSSCLEGPEIKTSKCAGLKVNDRVEFTAKIMVTACPANRRDWNQIIQIYPVGINESLIVDLEMLCSCDCEKPGAVGYERKSPVCNYAGTLMCGICACDDSFTGSKCECSDTNISLTNSTLNSCRPDNTTEIDCSGRGNCQCGQCECQTRANPEEKISGIYCECDNFSCERYKNALCSGPEHGECVCGRCQCLPGWTGSACDCRASNDTCMPPNGDAICSGHGECVCGACKCKVTEEGRYSGKYCEKCPTCSGRCHELKDCVQCLVHKNGPLKDPNDCATNCTLFTPVSIDKIEINEDKDEQLCVFFDEDDCKFTFKYSEQGDELKVYAQDHKECPPKVFMLGIVLGVIAAIVLIGLAILLLWKLLTTIHDRREFARFEKERMNAKWDTGENPIYKQATSTFKNPMYAGK